MTLTTNDVRVLRHLFDHGATTPTRLKNELDTRAAARLASLSGRGLVSDPFDARDFDITIAGARALVASDLAAYGAYS